MTLDLGRWRQEGVRGRRGLKENTERRSWKSTCRAGDSLLDVVKGNSSHWNEDLQCSGPLGRATNREDTTNNWESTWQSLVGKSSDDPNTSNITITVHIYSALSKISCLGGQQNYLRMTAGNWFVSIIKTLLVSSSSFRLTTCFKKDEEALSLL